MKLRYTNFTINYNLWKDWKFQVWASVSDLEQLSSYRGIKERLTKDELDCTNQFPMQVTPYYLTLIEWNNPNDPIRKQAIPTKQELETDSWELDDPLDEEKSSPVRAIVHRYPDRVLFTVSSICATYCRHCTRKRWAGHLPVPFTEEDRQQGIEYIRQHCEIRDVVVSGGDPLMLSDRILVDVLQQLSSIKHVEMIRIGTRIPVTLPMRITEDLAQQLGQFDKLWINTHFNHRNEITPESTAACRLLQKAGIPLNNQSVLLKGVNDTPKAMRDLVYGLTSIRVRPYYLYQCDLCRGLKHFRTDVQTGINLIKSLRGFTSGLCVPQFVIDSPKGGGKVPINPEYITSMKDDCVEFVNYQGNPYSYPRGVH